MSGHAKRQEQHKLRRLSYLVPGEDGRPVSTANVAHGAAATYVNWGCKCRRCTEAHSAYQRRRRSKTDLNSLLSIERRADSGGGGDRRWTSAPE